MADSSVRPARVADAAAVAAVQSRVWRTAYAAVLPHDVLDALEPAALAEPWRRAVTDPPTPTHRLLVACAGREVVGFVAFGPAEDPDLDPEADAELLALIVDPAARRLGHGSRLMAATVADLRSDGFARAYLWLAATDDELREFLRSGGWDADGAHRDLDLYGDGRVVVPQVRLHTDIGLDIAPDREGT